MTYLVSSQPMGNEETCDKNCSTQMIKCLLNRHFVIGKQLTILSLKQDFDRVS